MQSISEGREIVGVLVCSRDGPNKKNEPLFHSINKQRQIQGETKEIGKNINWTCKSFFFFFFLFVLALTIIYRHPVVCANYKKVYSPDETVGCKKVGLEVSKFWNKSARFSINFLSPYRAVYDKGLLYM